MGIKKYSQKITNNSLNYIIIDNVSDIIMRSNPDGKITYANKAWKTAFGYTDQDIESLNVESILVPEFIDSFNYVYKSVVAGTHTESVCIVLANKANKPVMVEGRVFTESDENGNITEVIWILNQLNLSEEILKLYLKDNSFDYYIKQSNISYLVSMLDEPIECNDNTDKDAVLDYVMSHDRVILVNKAYCTMFNIKDSNEILNKTPADIFNYDINLGKTTWRLMLESKQQNFAPYELSPGVRVKGYNKCIFNDAGQITGHVTSTWVVSDENELKKLAIEDQLGKKIADFRYLRRADGSTSIPYVGKEFSEITGLTPEEVRNNSESLEKLVFIADAERVKAAFYNSFLNMSAVEFEFRIIHPTKGLRWLKIIAHPEKSSDGDIWWQGYFTDITEGKQTEEWIEFLNTALMFIDDAVLVTGSFGDIIYANKSAEKLHGYSGEELIGKNTKLFLVDQLPEEVLGKMLGTLNEGKTYTLEALSKRKDGSSFIIESSTTPIYDENKFIKAYVLVQRDITEKKNILEALKNSNERFERLTKQSRAIAWEIDENCLVTYINNAVQEVLGYTPEEVIGKMYSYELLCPSIQQESKKLILENMKNRISFNDLILPVATKSGKILYLSTNGIPLIDDGNICRGCHGLSLDITVKVEMEQTIENEKERYRTTLLSVGDGVISTNSEGLIDVMNPVAEKLTGWTQKAAIGKPIDDVYQIVDELTGKPYPSPVKRVIETAESVINHDSMLLISKKGSEIPIESNIAPIKNQNGDMTGAVIVFRDFTEFRDRQKQIEFLSFRDPLTGLYNRRYMEDAIRRLDTKQNLPITIMVMDVNGLKLANDAFGHKMGDKLLETVAGLITSVCRSGDVIARMGGDEFYMLLPQTDEEKADRIKKRIKEACANARLDSIVVSLAVGYSVKSKVSEDIENTIVNADNQMYKEKLKFGKTMRNQTIETVLRNINFKYDSEQLHTERVSQYCEAIASAMKLSDMEMTDIKIAGSLHDIGKIMVPPELLNKPGRLTSDEFEIIKKHPETGYQILKSVDEYSRLAEYVLHHHERWDGNGYPAGLKEEEIPIQARIIAVADAFEAMTARRPYQKIRSTDEAKQELKKCAGSQLDPKIVNIFLNIV